jgi:hypothetical protein
MPLVSDTSSQRRRVKPASAVGLALLILVPFVLLLPSAISWDMPFEFRLGRFQFHAGRDAYHGRSEDFAQFDYSGPDFLNGEDSDDYECYLSVGSWTYKVLVMISKPGSTNHPLSLPASVARLSRTWPGTRPETPAPSRPRR